jgi:hypothetical protein
MLTARSVQTFPDGRTAVYTPTEVVNTLQSVLASPYTGKDPKKVGMTKGSAAFMALAEAAQDGDLGALESLLNRLLGKPVQQVNSLNVTATLSEFLGKLAEEMEKPEVIEVEVDPFGD